MAVISKYAAICEWCKKEGTVTLEENPEHEGLPRKEIPIYKESSVYTPGYNYYVEKYINNPNRKGYEKWLEVYISKEEKIPHKNPFVRWDTKYHYKYIFFCSDKCYEEWKRVVKISQNEDDWEYNI